MDIVIASIVVALYEMVAHWIPWQRLFFGGHAHPVWSYIVGCIGILIAMLVWAMFDSTECDRSHAVAALAAVLTVGGGAVVLAYAIDTMAELRQYRDGRQEMDVATDAVEAERR